MWYVRPKLQEFGEPLYGPSDLALGEIVIHSILAPMPKNDSKVRDLSDGEARNTLVGPMSEVGA